MRRWTCALPCMAVSCAALSLTSGCSILVVRPSPSVDQGTGSQQCSSRIPLVVDGVAAAGLALGGSVAVGFNRAVAECGSHPSDSRCQFSVAPYIPAAVAAASLVYGVWAASRCENALLTGEADHHPPAGAFSR